MDVRTINGRDDLGALLADGREFDVVVIHIKDDYCSSLEDLSALKHAYRSSECVVVFSSNVPIWRENFMHRGAYEYISMPFTKEILTSTLKAAVQYKVPVKVIPEYSSWRMIRSALLCSMDDTALYGSPFYEMTFGKAIERDHLTDFKVVVIFTTDTVVKRSGRMVSDDTSISCHYIEPPHSTLWHGPHLRVIESLKNIANG